MDRTPDGARAEGRPLHGRGGDAGRGGARGGAVGDRGAVKTADMRHDVAVYRAACAAHARIAPARGRVEAAAERRREAAELDLPMARGQVLFPDAQIEYVTAAGAGRRCNVEVASEHYGGRDIRAKAAAGFQMYAASGRAAAFVWRVLAGAGSGGDRGRRGGGRGGSREYEVFEI